MIKIREGALSSAFSTLSAPIPSAIENLVFAVNNGRVRITARKGSYETKVIMPLHDSAPAKYKFAVPFELIGKLFKNTNNLVSLALDDRNVTVKSGNKTASFNAIAFVENAPLIDKEQTAKSVDLPPSLLSLTNFIKLEPAYGFNNMSVLLEQGQVLSATCADNHHVATARANAKNAKAVQAKAVVLPQAYIAIANKFNITNCSVFPRNIKMELAKDAANYTFIMPLPQEDENINNAANLHVKDGGAAAKFTFLYENAMQIVSDLCAHNKEDMEWTTDGKQLTVKSTNAQLSLSLVLPIDDKKGEANFAITGLLFKDCMAALTALVKDSKPAKGEKPPNPAVSVRIGASAVTFLTVLNSITLILTIARVK